MKLKLIVILIFFSFTSWGNYSKDINRLRNDLKRAKSAREQFLILDYIFLNKYYHFGNKDSTTLGVCDTMLALAKSMNNDSFLARTYILYDVYYGSASNYVKTLQCIEKAIVYARKARYNDALSSAYKEYATIYKELGYYEAALNDLKIAQSYLQSKHDSLSYIQPNRVYYNIADVYQYLNQLDSARVYLEKATEVTDRVTDPYGYAKILNLRGVLFMRSHEHLGADGMFREAINLCETNGYFMPLAVSYKDYALFLMKCGSLDSSKTYALKCFRLSQRINSKLHMLNSSELLKKFFVAASRNDSNFYFLKLIDSLRQVAFNSNTNNQIANGILTDRIQYYAEETSVAAEKKERKQNISFAALGFCVISVLILFLSLSRTVIVRPKFISFMGNLAFLLFFELLNLIAHHQIAHYFGEHIFVMYALIVILASFLLPLHHRLQKATTKKLIENNKKIRLKVANATIKELTEVAE